MKLYLVMYSTETEDFSFYLIGHNEDEALASKSDLFNKPVSGFVGYHILEVGTVNLYDYASSH